MIGDWPGYIDGIYIGTNVGNEFRFSDSKVLRTTLGDIYGISLGT